MANLREHFQTSGYTLHREGLRRERLPLCCRTSLRKTGTGIRFLEAGGCKTVLPLEACQVCGRRYATEGKRYLPVRSLLQFDIVKM